MYNRNKTLQLNQCLFDKIKVPALIKFSEHRESHEQHSALPLVNTLLSHIFMDED